ncbi:TRAP transporter large permease [Brevibacterium yomogidense]|uniref:TRAP-type C4-dicarboxylate transport system, large permease component n=1 Tax=Brevibacterium yomogidense TaxID=946573 RepID=A0A1X6X8I3_9MICO|nr:TRAP transporter large permease [Brevibacterium yomogidense]SLM95518.1 TRAP-type C4-dicarboxylate transport system, large permease component [Brevibacterium yomogidense]
MTASNLTTDDNGTAAGAPSTTSLASGTLLPTGNRRKPGKTALIVCFVLLAVCLGGFFTSSSGPVAGLWCVAMMILLMFMSVPVAFSLAIPSLIGVYGLSGVPAMANILATSPFNAVSSWTYSVLPMFIFMGMLLAQSGMAARIYRATDRWFSWLPGGLGIGTTAAGAGLASVSGSTIGMTYTLGRAGIPEMLRAGYDKRMAVGTVIVSGLPGGLIPPSILLVVYAGIASVPVGPQLMAGAVPGILIACSFGLFIFCIGIFAPKLVGRGKNATGGVQEKVTWAQRFQSLGEIWGFPLIMIVLFGGMFSGAFTPTEAGAAAALTAMLLTLWYTRKNNPVGNVSRAAVSTVSSTAAIFFIIIGAEMLTKLLAITGLAPVITEFITGLGLNRIGFLLVLVVLYLFMGMFFDTLSMMLLTIPILLPTLAVMEVSPLWFGVFVVLLGELGMITPPVGILSFIVHNISKNPEVNLGQTITLKDIFTSLLWFLPVAVLFLILMIAVPQMTEWLPDLLERTAGATATQ